MATNFQACTIFDLLAFAPLFDTSLPQNQPRVDHHPYEFPINTPATTTKMWGRSQGITGSNNIPLGKVRRVGGGSDDGVDGVGDAAAYSNGNGDLKRGRSPERSAEVDGPRRRKKRNRWGDATENKAAGLMGLPTAIVANMTSEQLEAYTLHLRIEEITQKLKIDDVVPADGDRYVPFPSLPTLQDSRRNIC